MNAGKPGFNTQLLHIYAQDGPQYRFLATTADIAVYGGAAGGGKTYALLLDPMRKSDVPGFTAVIFRRTTEQVRNEGGLWDESQNVYGRFIAKVSPARLSWKFASGASIRFRHLQHEKDRFQYQGAQFAYIGFDELTHFTERQFFYLLSRNRSLCGVKPYVRATTNPDANSWVKRFLAPWVDKSFVNPASCGELRWFVRDGGQILWVPEGTGDAKSVTFIRASLTDNRILMEKDPGYLANLKALAWVDRRRLLEGDWDVVEGGNMFRREWFEILAVPPAEMRVCRNWDLAATRSAPGKDPDWTVGVLLGRSKPGFIILDVQRVRATPSSVESLIRQCAEADRARFGHVMTRMEQEPGSSGKAVVDRYAREVLAGFDFAGVPSTGSKADRARPLSAQSEAGNVKLLAGHWNHDFLNELCAFPTPDVHDDQVDAVSGALQALTLGVPFGAAYGGSRVRLDGYRF